MTVILLALALVAPTWLDLPPEIDVAAAAVLWAEQGYGAWST